MIDKLYNHLFVKHKDNEFVSGRVYTNTIENFWGLLKRGLLGIYHNTSKKHLQMYIDEFVFRYNTRQLNDCQRFDILLSKEILNWHCSSKIETAFNRLLL